MTLGGDPTNFPNGIDVGKLLYQGTDISASLGEVAALDGLTASVAELNKLDGVTATTAELNKLAGATVSTAELNKFDGSPLDASFVIGAEGGNVINVAIQLKDADGADLAVRGAVRAYLSDDANGDAIVAVAPDGGVAIGTDGLAIPLVASKAFELISEADGDIDINITHAAGAKTLYVILILPNGKLMASAAVTFA